MTQLYWKGTQTDGPHLWNINGSFFWRQLLKIKRWFHWSAYWQIGSGTTISFWQDSWQGAPLAPENQPCFPNISLAEALPLIHLIAPDLQLTDPISLMNQKDQLSWRWIASGTYSASSFYKAVMWEGKIRWNFMIAWQCKAPTTVRIFSNLMLMEKVLTYDAMTNRGIQCDARCVVCSTGETETALHLFFQFLYAQVMWRLVARSLGREIMYQGHSVQHIWEQSWRMVRDSGAFNGKTWATWFACTCWWLWKERNGIVFRGQNLGHRVLLKKILDDERIWLANC